MFIRHALGAKACAPGLGAASKRRRRQTEAPHPTSSATFVTSAQSVRWHAASISTVQLIVRDMLLECKTYTA